MRVSKWGNSLAVRLPAAVVEALDLKEGDEVELHLRGDAAMAVSRKPDFAEVLKRLDRFADRLPADFKFDREEANER